MHSPGEEGTILMRVLEDAENRLSTDDLQWWAFPETWGSTSLGFGGLGGQVITTAQTHVVLGPNFGLLYWGGRFARLLSPAQAQETTAARRSKR